MNKRILSFVLAFLCALSLVGCGGEAAPETTTPVTTAAPTEPAPDRPSQAAIDALDGKKVLFIGNSYTYWGSCVINVDCGIMDQKSRTGDKGLFYQLCKENGIDVEVTNWVFAGHNFTDIMSEECLQETASCLGSNHLSYLTDPYFDYVFMQCFFETEYAGDIVSHLKPAMDFFREANPDVKFLFLVPHMTYVRNFKWRDELSALPEAGVTVCNWGGMLNDLVNKVVQVPGGTQQYFMQSFVISRTEDDGHHQNLLAGYLTALMGYCAITGESAVGQPYAFVNDPSIHPNFDMEAFKQKNYTGESFTNFIDIYNSEADMKGLQQLTDEYLQKFNPAR